MTKRKAIARRGQAQSLLGTLITIALIVLIWWVNNRSTPPTADSQPSNSSTVAATPVATAAPVLQPLSQAEQAKDDAVEPSLADSTVDDAAAQDVEKPSAASASAAGERDQRDAVQENGAQVDKELERSRNDEGEVPTATPPAAEEVSAQPTLAPTATSVPTSTPRPRPTATPTPRGPPGMPVVYADEIPSEAWDTLDLIFAGGPFPYRQDDSIFQNREGLLPSKPRGYYREYTVETPGSRDRGARRIVAGENGELYYTDDHYESFSWIELE